MMALVERVGDVQSLREAWTRFQAAGEKCRMMLEATDRFKDYPHLRGQAYATLAEAQAMAYNFAVQPVINGVNGYQPEPGWHATWHHNLYHLGQSVQDFQYGGLLLDGRKTYRLSGRIGEVQLLLLQVHNHLLGDPRSEEIGNYDFHQAFDIGEDGTFEVVLGASEKPGDWIKLDAGSEANFLLIRRIVGDWNDDLGEIHIEVLDAPDDPEPMGEGDPIAVALDSAAHFMIYLTDVFTVGLYNLYVTRAENKKNAWAAMPGAEVATSLIGSRSTTYCPAVFEIRPDEALVLEWDVPTSAYWGFQVGDVWSRPLDFIHHQTDLNMRRATIDADGKVRAVVCIEDPGLPNWLDPCGNLEGTLVTRNYRCVSETIPPQLSVAKVEDLYDHLPRGTPRIAPEDRARALAYRREGVMKLMGH